ncbi:MAG: bifunctional diguanylate cyclase/phosphodiesterase [Paracoccaceae bacterium]
MSLQNDAPLPAKARRMRQAGLAVLLAGGIVAWFALGSGAALAVAAIALPLSYAVGRGAEAPPKMSGIPENAASARDGVSQALDRALAEDPSGGLGTACLCIEIDDAIELAGRLGQRALDQSMSQCGERLTSVLRQGDRIARTGEARFSVALAPARRMDLETVIRIAGRLRSAVAEPLSLDAMTLNLSASIGFCLPSRASERTGKALLQAAERALDDARRNGPGAIRAYTAVLAQAFAVDAEIRNEIVAALDSGEIVAHFQPQISTDTGDLTGFEALARWQHPRRGVLAPSDFLPAVLEAGLSERLSEVMLGQALAALRAWDKAGLRVPNVSVNFSREELRNPNLSAKLRWELDRFDLAPDRLVVEILESVVAETDNDVIVHNITALSRLGCSIDLDDFGTGHASIAAIRRFAVDRIKIDRSFVTRVDSDPDQQRMAGAILSMAERLGLGTLAEGVETIGEHAILAQLGCGHVQGFVIARPMPFSATAEWLAKHRAKISATPGISRSAG